MSARSPFTVSLPNLLFEDFSQPCVAFRACLVDVGKPQLLQPDLFVAVLRGQTIFLVAFRLMFTIVAFDDSDLFMTKCWNPTDDLCVSHALLKIGYQVQ